MSAFPHEHNFLPPPYQHQHHPFQHHTYQQQHQQHQPYEQQSQARTFQPQAQHGSAPHNPSASQADPRCNPHLGSTSMHVRQRHAQMPSSTEATPYGDHRYEPDAPSIGPLSGSDVSRILQLFLASPEVQLRFDELVEARVAERLGGLQRQIEAIHTAQTLSASPSAKAPRVSKRAASCSYPPSLMSAAKHNKSKKADRELGVVEVGTELECHSPSSPKRGRRTKEPSMASGADERLSALFSHSERYLVLDAIEHEMSQRPGHCRRTALEAVLNRWNGRNDIVVERLKCATKETISNMLSYWAKHSGWATLDQRRSEWRRGLSGLSPEKIIELERLATEADPENRKVLVVQLAKDRDPIGARKAIRDVCKRTEEKGLLWSLEIAAAFIETSPEWVDVQHRFRNAPLPDSPAKKKTAEVMKRMGFLPLSRTAIWEELRNTRGANEDTYVFRKPLRKPVENLAVWQKRLEREIAYLRFTENIPLWAIYNGDETSIRMFPKASRKWCHDSMAPRAAIRATSAFTTILMAVSAEGEVLRPQVNFRGSTDNCKTPVTEENKSCVQFSSPKTHWSSVESICNYIDAILVPNFEARMKVEKNLHNEMKVTRGQTKPSFVTPKWIFLLDHAPIHNGEAFRFEFHRRYHGQGFLVFIPPNVTGELQPMDQAPLFGTFKPQLKRAQAIDVTTGHAEHNSSVNWNLKRVKASLVRCTAQAYNSLVVKATSNPEKFKDAWKFCLTMPETKKATVIAQVANDAERKKLQLFVFGLPNKPPLPKGECGYEKDDSWQFEISEWDDDTINDDGEEENVTEAAVLRTINEETARLTDEMEDLAMVE